MYGVPTGLKGPRTDDELEDQVKTLDAVIQERRKGVSSDFVFQKQQDSGKEAYNRRFCVPF